MKNTLVIYHFDFMFTNLVEILQANIAMNGHRIEHESLTRIHILTAWDNGVFKLVRTILILSLLITAIEVSGELAMAGNVARVARGDHSHRFLDEYLLLDLYVLWVIVLKETINTLLDREHVNRIFHGLVHPAELTVLVRNLLLQLLRLVLQALHFVGERSDFLFVGLVLSSRALVLRDNLAYSLGRQPSLKHLLVG